MVFLPHLLSKIFNYKSQLLNLNFPISHFQIPTSKILSLALQPADDLLAPFDSSAPVAARSATSGPRGLTSKLNSPWPQN
jgi:hypothetical protein